MKKAFFIAVFLLAIQPASAQQRAAARPPAMRVGTCVRTTIAEVTQRLEDGSTHRVIPDSG